MSPPPGSACWCRARCLLAAYGQAQAQPDPYTIAAGLLFLLGLIVFLRMMIRKWSVEIGVTSHALWKNTACVDEDQ